MRIDHIAIWTFDLEKVKNFYVKYFKASCTEKYINKEKNFSSYFLSFSEGHARIELMHNPGIKEFYLNHATTLGLTHFSISVGTKARVDRLTEKLHIDGFRVISEPRITGDGYYESIVEDCESNRIEISE